MIWHWDMALDPALRSGTYTCKRGMVCMGGALRFIWDATRGNRLRPWRSPYLRWRLETYSGQRGETGGGRGFWNLFWKGKRQFFRFLRWPGEMKGSSESEKRP